MAGRRFKFRFNLDKRKKFVLAIILLSFGLLISQFMTGISRIVTSFLLATFSAAALLAIIYKDIKGTFAYPLFILPFFYTLALGLFYFLVPERFLTRLLVTVFFATTTYALFLAHNIYAVSSIRTIQLFRAAHAVNLFLTIIAFFILIDILFTLHLAFYFLFLLLFIVSAPLILQLLWSVTLDNTISEIVLIFTLSLSFMIAQVGAMLSFWPATPTVAALFISGAYYTFVGLSQYWLEKRLFKGILWEYIWVVVVVFLVLLFATKWG